MQISRQFLGITYEINIIYYKLLLDCRYFMKLASFFLFFRGGRNYKETDTDIGFCGLSSDHIVL
jgi:hypothetical protein